MLNLLAGIAPVAGVLRLAGGLLRAATPAGPKGASFADVQQQVLEAQARRAEAASAGVPASAAAAQGHEQVLRAQAQRLLRRLDADGNGTLTAGELGLAADEFQHIDLNGDSAVDVAELIQGMQSPSVHLWKVQ